jgi:HK97 family phage portal protein
VIETSLFDKLFRRQPKETKIAPTLSGYMPIYGQTGVNVYAYDTVRQSLKRIVEEMMKLNPTHVRYKDSDPVPVKGTVQDVLNNPNPLMTTAEFIEKTTWMLLLNCNAFIIPVYRVWTDEKTGEERRYYEALYPIRPMQVDFIEDLSGRLFVKFWFYDGEQTTIPYDNVIHIRTDYAINEYMGGNEAGQPDNSALMETVKLTKTLLNGVAEAMKASYAINGVLKYNSYIDEEKMQAEITKFEQKIANSQSGILPVDLKCDFTPMERKAAIVDQNTMKFVDDKIARSFGVSAAILSGDYTKAQYEAFYSQCLEPLTIKFSQAFTKKMFTSREKAFGNRIEFLPEQLVFLTMQQRLELINTLAPQGGGFVNEYRTWLGLAPLPELEGKRFMSLNWIDANNAAQYQVGKDNVDIIDEEKEEI